MKINIRKISFLALSVSLAMIFSYVEAMLPPVYIAVPGIKMGLANIVVVAVLYKFSIKEAAIISLLRVVLSSLLFGSTLTMTYSFAGAVLSLIVMWIFKNAKIFSVLGVSILGGISHNIGQIAVAVFLFDRIEIWYYLAVLALTGTLSGIFVGIFGALAAKTINKFKI